MSSERINATREAIVKNAEDIGINSDYISDLVDNFYDRIRDDKTLGPIFDTAIDKNWEPHLNQMKAFWASVTMNAGLYSGKPVEQHRKHTDLIESEHFDIWLTLFRQTLEDTAPTPACVDYFMVRANRIANSLKLAMFGTTSFWLTARVNDTSF